MAHIDFSKFFYEKKYALWADILTLTSAKNNIFDSPGTSLVFLTISYGHFKPL